MQVFFHMFLTDFKRPGKRSTPRLRIPSVTAWISPSFDTAGHDGNLLSACRFPMILFGIVSFIQRPLSSCSGSAGIVSHIPPAARAAVTARQAASSRSSGLHLIFFAISHMPAKSFPGRYFFSIVALSEKPGYSFFRVITTDPHSLAKSTSGWLSRIRFLYSG